VDLPKALNAASPRERLGAVPLSRYNFPMAYGVFMHRADSIYDDRPEEQYQFPPQYLGRAREVVGDWIVYLEPTKVKNSRGYFAIARVQEVIPDPKAPGMYLAIIAPGSYLDFVNPVPFSDAAGPIEHGVLNAAGAMSGRAQSAVRPVSPADFSRILARGLPDDQPPVPHTGEAQASAGFAEEQAPFIAELVRERVQQITTRALRDRVFRSNVLRAYGERCALTGLKLINGGGLAEVEAAHIRPVEQNGPDSIGNGIALSRTAHWMFDRGLIGLSDDLDILISRQANDPDSIRAFVNGSGRAHRPARFADRPHPHYLRWHRDNCFKS
jgi:putative restriction endonuclease